ncbi:thioesterase II family protein [Flavobacteriaceae bacterium M23B6Z8]
MLKKVNLFVLPHAGGHSHSYQGFEKFIASNIKIIPLEYPGRGTRAGESLIGEIHALVDDIFEQIKNRISSPFAIYGHSMGALVGILLVHKIIENTQRYPLHFFASGACGPTVKDKSEIYHLNSNDFWAELANQGGIAKEILKDQDLKNYLEPILRNDAKVTELYHHDADYSMKSIPITVFMGSDDQIAPANQAISWQKETTLPITIFEFKGGHFFIFDEIQKITRIFNEKISEKSKHQEAKLIHKNF